MVGEKYKTRYTSIVRKGSVGTCVVTGGHELKIRFDNGDEFYFYKRDLIKSEDE